MTSADLYDYAEVLALNPDVQDAAREAGIHIDDVALDMASSHARMGTPIEQLMVPSVEYPPHLIELTDVRGRDA